jgi:two-component system, response regulator
MTVMRNWRCEHSNMARSAISWSGLATGWMRWTISLRGKYAGRDVGDQPAVMLLDLNIPKIDGLEVLKAIRADERTKLLPVVILTTSNEDKDRLSAYEHYANSYVVKPIDYDQFIAATSHLSLYWTSLNAPPPRKEA